MLTSLRNKSVIVTGGTKGVGKGIATILAGLGAQVCILGRNENDGVAVVEALRKSGGTVKFCRGDVKEQADMETVAATTAAEFGGVDILCANAGIFPAAKLEELTESTWDEVLATNLKGMLFSIQACLLYLKRSLRVNRSGVAERRNSLQTLGVMATNLTPLSPDALLKIVEQVKEYYVEPPPNRQRGRPRTFSGRAFLLLALVGVVLRTFKPQELATLLTKDLTLRQALGFERVPHRRTLERRLDAPLPEAEAQGQALGHQLLAEVEPGPEESPTSAIAGRMDQAQGPLWHKRDRAQGRVPTGLRHVDTESAWSKRGYRGWGQGYRLVRQGLVFPAPVPLFARWCSNAGGESTVRAQALAAEQFPVTELFLGDATFGGVALVATYALQGGWLLTSPQWPVTPDSWKRDLYAYRRETIELLFQRLSQACDRKPCPPKGLARTGTFVIASGWLSQALFLDNHRQHRPVTHLKELLDEGRWRIAA